MGRSIYTLFLVVLTICLINVLSFAYANSESLPIPTNSEEPESYEVDINILALTFYNAMPRGNKNVNLYYNNQVNGVSLEPGKSYFKLDNLNGSKSAIMYWDGNCISFLAYDPSAEGNNQKIFWMVKQDGLYHSVDNKSWQKRKSWTFNRC